MLRSVESGWGTVCNCLRAEVTQADFNKKVVRKGEKAKD